MKKQQWRWLLTVICVLAAGICYSCSRQGVGLGPDGQERIVLSADVSEETEVCEESDIPMTESIFQMPLCYVHICGAVVRPGVYEMKSGDRIFQVLELAGGYTEDAAEEYLNLAQEVEDGMQLLVPSKADLEAGADRNQVLGAAGQGMNGGVRKVNLNTAAKAELMTLKGIGEVRAEDIVEYREKHGPFSRIEDVMNVPGIKDAAFQKIKDDITV